jgi:hypothetical protein
LFDRLVVRPRRQVLLVAPRIHVAQRGVRELGRLAVAFDDGPLARGLLCRSRQRRQH